MLTKAIITLKVLTAEMQREAGQGLAEAMRRRIVAATWPPAGLRTS